LPGLTPQSICIVEGFLRRWMDARIKSGQTKEQAVIRLRSKNRGRRWMIASHPLNRTTVL
jgi:hypothetical protein